MDLRSRHGFPALLFNIRILSERFRKRKSETHWPRKKRQYRFRQYIYIKVLAAAETESALNEWAASTTEAFNYSEHSVPSFFVDDLFYSQE